MAYGPLPATVTTCWSTRTKHEPKSPPASACSGSSGNAKARKPSARSRITSHRPGVVSGDEEIDAMSDDDALAALMKELDDA